LRVLSKRPRNLVFPNKTRKHESCSNTRRRIPDEPQNPLSALLCTRDYPALLAICPVGYQESWRADGVFCARALRESHRRILRHGCAGVGGRADLLYTQRSQAAKRSESVAPHRRHLGGGCVAGPAAFSLSSRASPGRRGFCSRSFVGSPIVVSQFSEIFKMKSKRRVSPGTLEFTANPVSGLELLLSFQGLHQPKESPGIARISPETFA